MRSLAFTQERNLAFIFSLFRLSPPPLLAPPCKTKLLRLELGDFGSGGVIPIKPNKKKTRSRSDQRSG